jgi:hypothetical protein
MYFGTLRLGEMKDHGILDLLAVMEEVEFHERFKIRDDAEIRAAEACFFFRFPEGRHERVFALLEMPFREVPVSPATVQQEVLIAFFGLTENNEARYHLGLYGLFFRFRMIDT